MKIKTDFSHLRTLVTLLFVLFTYLPWFTDVQAQTLSQQYRELWSEAKGVYDKAVGYSSETIPLTADNLSSNASDWQEGQHLEYLLDDNPSTFWHSDWHGQVQDTHYLQIDLAQPIEGAIALYVKRRETSDNHVTQMECHASKDGVSWVCLDKMFLPNAYSGADATSNPVSLGNESYTHIRFYFLQNSGGYKFAHFAEIRLLSVKILGEGMTVYLSKPMTSLLSELEDGKRLADKDITSGHIEKLKSAMDNLVLEMERIEAGLLPSFMTQKTNIPTLFINTYDGTKISSKTEYKYARMWRMDGDSIAVYDSVKIRGRGNSTWGLEKKPYRIKFNAKEKFLGKGHANAKSWTLLANHSDKTLLRNAVASFIGKQMGQPFVPAAEFADVVLNGEYLGNYQISDQMEVNKKRVNIVEQKEPPMQGTDISGGYFFEFAGTLDGEPSYFYTDRGQAVAIKSPDEDVITAEQHEYIRNFVNEFENRLYSSDYKDPQKGYQQMVDSTTLASWFVSNEYTANPDGYYSTYAYKERGDNHLCWGPMWDYDIAFNNCYRLRKEMTDKLMLNDGYSSGKMKEYVQRMYSDEWFRNIAGRTWHKAVCRDSLVEKALGYVDSMSLVIDQSQRLNFQRWSLGSRVYDELMLFSTYQEGVDYLKKFLKEHASFLSSTLPNPDGLLPPLPLPNNPLGVDEEDCYYLYNVKTQKVTDIGKNNKLCIWEAEEGRASTQLWQLIPASEDYYRIVLQGSNLAITDAASYNGMSYSTGSTLILTDTDPDDYRQLWKFVSTAGNYAIVNKVTGLGWNNSGGNDNNGNPIISWTSDDNNAEKPTRQWYIVRGERPDDIASNDEELDVDYRVGYDRAKQEILLHTPLEIASSNCNLSVYDTNGRLVGMGDAFHPVSLANQPSAIYVVTWNVHGSQRSIKFQKP